MPTLTFELEQDGQLNKTVGEFIEHVPDLVIPALELYKSGIKRYCRQKANIYVLIKFNVEYKACSEAQTWRWLHGNEYRAVAQGRSILQLGNKIPRWLYVERGDVRTNVKPIMDTLVVIIGQVFTTFEVGFVNSLVVSFFAGLLSPEIDVLGPSCTQGHSKTDHQHYTLSITT